jgi:hypothetical protein
VNTEIILIIRLGVTQLNVKQAVSLFERFITAPFIEVGKQADSLFDVSQNPQLRNSYPVIVSSSNF